MMGYSFRPGLHACSVDQSVVFLDVSGDRYFALTGQMGAACLRLVAGENATPGDDVFVASLLKRQIICQSPEYAQPTLCSPVPEIISLEDSENDGSPSFSEIAMAFARQIYAIGELRMRRLENILGKFARQKNSALAASTLGRSPSRATRTFAIIDRAISSHGRCLPRSVALARTLIVGGSEPILVLGVKLRPFEAHCWVQVGNRLIGDDPGRVAPFTPILSI